MQQQFISAHIQLHNQRKACASQYNEQQSNSFKGKHHASAKCKFVGIFVV